MSYPRYPSYRDSGVPWLGQVPAHWETLRLKYIVSLRSDKVPALDVEDTYIGMENIASGTAHWIEGTSSLEIVGTANCFQKDDVLFGKLRPYLAKVYHCPSDGIASTEFFVLEPKAVSPEFLSYFLLSDRFINLVDSSTYGAKMPRANWEFISNIRWCVPTIEEQRVITVFLDRETTEIDALIKKQQQLIVYLEERLKVFSTQLLTKGMNCSALTKDSGITWLGETPKHWKIERLKYLCDIQTGGKDTVDAVDDGLYPFFVRSQTIERINSFSFDCEAVLTAGDGVGVGKVFHYYQGPFDFHQRVYMLNNFRNVTGRFFYHYLKNNFYKVALEGNAKSTVDSLRLPMFLNFPVCVPPINEQNEIIGAVETESTKIKNLTRSAQSTVALLQERRAALITAAVTGQIDVRGM